MYLLGDCPYIHSQHGWFQTVAHMFILKKVSQYRIRKTEGQSIAFRSSGKSVMPHNGVKADPLGDCAHFNCRNAIQRR